MDRIASRDVLLQLRGIEDAAGFYRDVLGLELFLRTPGLIGLDAGHFRLFLEEAEPLGPVFEFFTRDFDGTKAKLREAGCVMMLEDASVPKCYFRDPFGLIFNLAQQPHTQPEENAEEIRPAEPPPHY
jgi:catechol 2,3-dioxygenase-like lactoylglutathione lyase family enzyme